MEYQEISAKNAKLIRRRDQFEENILKNMREAFSGVITALEGSLAEIQKPGYRERIIADYHLGKYDKQGNVVKGWRL